MNMAALINSVVETFQAQAPDRYLVKVDQVEFSCVWGDPEQLQIVLDNLISNALKYSAPQSPITITAEIHRVPTDKDNGQMLISVTNFGSFIPPAEQEKLFIKFYRRGEGQQAKGYGLGLPLARWLVERHGGQLEVESSIEEGTTFWFTVPLAAG
jgi:signal transduction histidine kinase